MKFDKTRVYTVADAEQVKIGSKGYADDDYVKLMEKVQDGNTDRLLTLAEVGTSPFPFMFRSSCGEGYTYKYFYLVEEPKA